MSKVMKSEYNLRPIWNELLGIYKIFSEICEKHGLRHWVVYGTLIGAIRHHGFIPWDDDLDVTMPREDYNRFQEIIQSELPGGYKWRSIYTDQTYNRTFGKVHNCKEDVLSRVARESNLDIVEGLFIDVFPFDGLPSSKFGFFVWQAARSLLRRYASMKALDWFFSRIPYEKSEIVGYANSGWGVRKRIIKRREWMSRLIQVPFEDTFVSVPAEYDDYLRCEFDDYMQFPPIEQRVPTHQLR